MKKITGKLLDLMLLIFCFALFVVVLPEWICIFAVGVGLIICVISMISSNFFGRF